MDTLMRRVVCLLATVVFVLSSGGCALGGSATVKYPTKPIDLIVPWAPGGGCDLSARVVAAYATKQLGVPVNVVNVTGASGVTGMLQALTAAPDGYTLLMDGNVTSSFMYAARTDLPLALEDRTFIARATTDYMYYMANVDAGWKTIAEELQSLKSRPQEFTWGAGAYGSTPMFSQVDLFLAAGIDMDTIKKSKMVVFEAGNAPSLQACAKGDVKACVGTAGDVESMLATGRIRVLATSAPERTKEYPDIPTGKELGYPEADFLLWYGVAGPKGLPDYVVKTWDGLIQGAMKDPDALAAASKAKKAWAYLPAADYKAYVLKEYEVMVPIATALGIRK